MGGQRCIAFGCKSGHKRGLSKIEKEKKEKIYFFQVPKADTELWKRALLRKDIVIKAGHSVCEKHFPREDVLWRKELRGPDGRILGVSADYKIPKLRKGALPSMYLGITADGKPAETSDFYIKESPVELETKNDRVNTIAIANLNTNPVCNKEKNKDVNIEKETDVGMKNHALVECTLVIPDKTEEVSLFEIIFENEKSIALPVGWGRQNMRYDGKRLVHFCQFVPRKEEQTIQPTCVKEVLVNDKLERNIWIMRQKIQKDKSDVQKDTLSCLEDLEHLLQVVNSWKICSGLQISSNEEVQASFVRKDKEGILRSENCSLYMPGICRSGCCDECRKHRKTISRKVSRMKNESDSPRFGSNLSTQQRRKLDEMRQLIKTLRRGRERALTRIRILKDLRIRDLQAYKASQKGVEQLLNESGFDGNQKLVMWEMLSASKQVDSRARRYSRVWISFCLTLHKKSPVTYRFLRQNKVLPLPSPRTVLRFAQHNPSMAQNISNLNVEGHAMNDATTLNVTLQEDIIQEEDMPDVEMETEVS